MTDRTQELVAYVFDPHQMPEHRPAVSYEEGDTAIIPTRDGPVTVTFGPRVRTSPIDALGISAFGSLGQDSCTPGLPDPALVGDWAGDGNGVLERQAAAYDLARRRLRALHTSLSRLRQMWALSTRECSASRAVAYQTAMQRIGAILEDIESTAAGS